MTICRFATLLTASALLSACTSQYESTYISRNDFYNTPSRNDAGQALVDCLNQAISQTPNAKIEVQKIAKHINNTCSKEREIAFNRILQEQMTPGGKPINHQQAQDIEAMRARFEDFTTSMIANNIMADRKIKL